MDGTSNPSSVAPPVDSAIAAVPDQKNFYAESGQELYSGLWAGTYVDNNWSRIIPEWEQLGLPDPADSPPGFTSFSPSSSNKDPVNNNAYSCDTAVDQSSDTDPIDLPADPTAIGPTIQFDLGPNMLSSEQSNAEGFAAGYEYASDEGIGNHGDTNQSCFAGDTSFASSLWSGVHNFNSPPLNQADLSNFNLGSSTVDYTARWDGGNSLMITPSAPNVREMMAPLHPQDPGAQSLAPSVRRPSKAVEAKIELALQQRFYVVDRKISGDTQAPSVCDYRIMDAMGNSYAVRMSTSPSCTCGDANCTHLLFVMMRVLKLARVDHRLWQTALLPHEVGPLLKQAVREQEVVITSQRARHQCLAMSHQAGDIESGVQAEAQLLKIQADVNGDCPICYQPVTNLDGSSREELANCKVCGNSVHAECFQQWSLSRQETGEKAACIFCCSLWYDNPFALKKRKARSDVDQDTYMSLNDYSSSQSAGNMTLQDSYMSLKDYSSSQSAGNMALASFCPQVRPKSEREWNGC